MLASSPSKSGTWGTEFWATIIPFTFVVLVILSASPPIDALVRSVKSRPLFAAVLTLEEARALSSEDVLLEDQVPVRPPFWRTVVLSAVSFLLFLLWIGVACYSLAVDPGNKRNGTLQFLIGATWLYAAVRPVARPTATVPYDLLVFFGMRLISDVTLLAGLLYGSYARVTHSPPLTTTPLSVDLLGAAGVFVIILNMPFATLDARVKDDSDAKGKAASPEDYTTVWGWMTFRWLTPLLDLGMTKTLTEEDIWSLSPLQRARPLHIKFSRTGGRLFKRLLKTHSLELLVDILLSSVGVWLAYLKPYFLKLILDGLSAPADSSATRTKIYVYAFVSFAASICRSQVDANRLWVSRRASGRVRSELIASIYDKTLQRKHFSGTGDRRTSQADVGPSTDDTKNAREAADVGKIVNLMSGDVDRITQTVANLYFLYQCPLDILFAALFLYRLLGSAAFIGFLVLLLTWPLNDLAGKRAIGIQRGLSNARDKRMGALSELLSAIKLVKFFAWEDRWIQRVLHARHTELQCLVKARMNAVVFSLIQTCIPILVSVTSFLVFVGRGNELTVGIAFTAITLFDTIREPFKGIQTSLVQVLQARVALDRIGAYLDEDEVDEQVSTRKKRSMPSSGSEQGETGLGIVNGMFKWNEAEGNRPRDMNSLKPHNAERSGADPANDTSMVAGNSSFPTPPDSIHDRRFELKDINIRFPERKLTVITGPTGSGKTALLMALLGELTMLEGRLLMSKDASDVDEHGLSQTISYTAQSPWLQHRSIKDNILFGHPYDGKRYEAVLESCALKPDLEILEDGDETEIGVRGVSLSGGQKARVALARAVYAPSRYVLLDDPLSAVDSHTARFLFEKLLKGPLLSQRTVILVTHHVGLVLPAAHYLVRMLDGRMDIQGPVTELQERGILDVVVVAEERHAQQDEEQATQKAQDPVTSIKIDDAETAQKGAKKARKLVEEEHREVGMVKWSIYKTYLRAASYWTWCILVFLVILTQVLRVGEKLWIKVWGEAYSIGAEVPALRISYASYAERRYTLNASLPDVCQQVIALHTSLPPSALAIVHLPPAQESPYFYVGIYTAITLAAGLVSIAGVVTQYTGALRASRILFERLLRSVVRATMRWHDTTPQGRILNRFSKDMGSIDSSLAESLHALGQCSAMLAASVLTVMAVFPAFIFPAAVLGYFYYRTTVIYLNTSRDIQRMESNSRSPIFANFGELLEGIVTVRAFGAEQRFLDGLYGQLDFNTQMWYLFWMLNRWLMLNLDLLAAIVYLITMLFAIGGYVDAGLAGVCITSAMSFTTSVYWVCRNWTALELDLNSIERVKEYIQVPQEPPAVIESNRPPAYWPSSTGPNKERLLAVEDLVVRYAPDLPAVLHDISFALKARERVGLLGRTGSGKSTLAMSLLRFVEPTSGRILIDGVDITSIGLYDLRSRITFIPQDAILFSGTLRDNLDPFGDHTDAECIDVLCRVHLITDTPSPTRSTSSAASTSAHLEASVSEISEEAESAAPPPQRSGTADLTLDTQVSAGGANFSQGQRQLIAIARALLRRSAVVILDEATSSIDFETDAKIQAVIREEFADSLLVTVAHRLRTIIDYDRLIVLDQGKLAEFDTPMKLMQKEDGIFRNMCLQSGSFAELEAAAKAKAAASGAH
ncbi:multidrug resistance-associated ABC transporter [Trametes cingulata]|nr:multidrug resistance-associated ABC transporter [Trametes cingulata]